MRLYCGEKVQAETQRLFAFWKLLKNSLTQKVYAILHNKTWRMSWSKISWSVPFLMTALCPLFE
jgi:hypothetical protein